MPKINAVIISEIDFKCIEQSPFSTHISLVTLVYLLRHLPAKLGALILDFALFLKTMKSERCILQSKQKEGFVHFINAALGEVSKHKSVI